MAAAMVLEQLGRMFPTTNSTCPGKTVTSDNIQGSRPRKTSTKRPRLRQRSIYIIETESDSGPSDKPVPPDGGYGWIIVIAAHLIHIMGIGFLYSLGIFFIEWRKYFGSSAAETSLVTSLPSLTLGITSPIAVGISGKVGGARPLVMTGAVIVFIGLLSSSFATTILQLTFTIGVLTAFGYGLVCSTSILAIAEYFDDNYVLANGIGFSGVSIGQLIFPSISLEFIYRFGGWRGAMLIFSALSLNIAVCGALLRPLKKSKSSNFKLKSKAVYRTALPTLTGNCKKPPMAYQNDGYLEDVAYNNSSITSTSCNRHSDKELPPQTEREQPIFKISSTVCDQSNYLKSSRSEPAVIPTDTTIQKYLHKLKAILSSFVVFVANCYGIPGVFLSPLFVIMIPAIFCVAIGFYAIITHQAARALSDGISEENASLLLSFMGIGSLIGRLSHGWFIDRGFFTTETCLVVSLGVCSVSTYLVPVATYFPVLCVVATFQGLTAGIADSVVCVVIRTFVKPGCEDASFGMLYLIWGFGDLTGGVVAGYLYDSTGNYNVSFYFAGTALAASTILVYATCVIKERIVNKLYAKYELNQLHLSRGASSRELSDNAITFGNECGDVDNGVFLEDASPIESINIVNQSGDDVHRAHLYTGNHRSMFQIEIHNTWERGCILSDTNL